MVTLSGVAVGIFFDFYRIVRWQLGLNKFLTFIGDIFFSCAAVLIIYYFAQKANYLELRFYLFLGSLLGLLLYLRILSSPVKKLIIYLIRGLVTLKNLLKRALIFVFSGIARLLTLFMSVPYGLLRWFSLLLFRILEALWREIKAGLKIKIPKRPKEW
ncbi:MAG: spore cortex biosynthesis protein YabQ [Peptococcaceae bacterium]|nr:spore cortex biosynthesis protein YabQ [Peptococcaceae bacterium]